MLDEDNQHADIHTDDYFARIEYLSIHDIIDAVKDYHAHISRPYKVSVSDTRRFSAICPNEGCSFMVHFAFGRQFKRPNKSVPHSCVTRKAQIAYTRKVTAKRLVKEPSVRAFF